MDVDGTDLERITYTPGFDGFPMFSPDGEYLVFASNRNEAVKGQTDIYLAKWNGDGRGDVGTFPDDLVHAQGRRRLTIHKADDFRMPVQTRGWELLGDRPLHQPG